MPDFGFQFDEVSLRGGVYTETRTEDDPDGSDRGGFHQVTDRIRIKDQTLLVEQEVSDYWEERCGEAPEPPATNKGEAVVWLEGAIRAHQEAVTRLEEFLAKVRETTEFKFTTNAEESDDED